MKLLFIIIYIINAINITLSDTFHHKKISLKQFHDLEMYTKYSAIAYCPLLKIKHFNCIQCKDHQLNSTHSINAFNSSIYGMQGYIAINAVLKTIIIVIRGRTNFLNTKSILHFNKKPFRNKKWASDIKIHKGFHRSYESIHKKIKQLLLPIVKRYSGYEIVYSGHSLGGAIASLLVLDAFNIYDGYLRQLVHTSSVSLYNIGSPRVGNEKFAANIDSLNLKNVYRIVNYTDPIPHLPFPYLGFKHFRRQVFLQENGTAVFCNDVTGEDTDCTNTITPTKYKLSNHKSYFGVILGRNSHC